MWVFCLCMEHKCFGWHVFQLLRVESTVFADGFRIKKAKPQLYTSLKVCSRRLATKQLWYFFPLKAFCPDPSPGAIHLQFHSSGNHYVWRKVTSTVHNIIVGKLWIDQVSRWYHSFFHSSERTILSEYHWSSREVYRWISLLCCSSVWYRRAEQSAVKEEIRAKSYSTSIRSLTTSRDLSLALISNNTLK